MARLIADARVEPGLSVLLIGQALGARVIVVAEMDKAPHAETVAALHNELQCDGVVVEVLVPARANHAALAGARLIVTVGGQAAHAIAALEAAAPILHVLLSRRTLDTLVRAPGGASWSAIVLDQPAERQIALEIDESALALLGNVGFDPVFGARPLKRAIQQRIENPLSRLLLEGRYPPKSVIPVGVDPVLNPGVFEFGDAVAT